MLTRKSALYLILSIAVGGCDSEDATKREQSPAARALVAVQEEKPGEACPAGGKLVQFGADDNSNDVLDEDEIDQAMVLCDGLEGTAGPQGDPGTDGSQGAAGEAGPQGNAGLQGDAGLQGNAGPQGNAGLPGDKGDTGENGIKGDTGENGIKGDKGDTGENGIKGDTGLKGDTGENGIKGDKGDSGDQGNPGYNSLIRLTTLPVGGVCDFGGTLIEVGLDNGDGDSTPSNTVLEDDEVDDSTQLCSAAPLCEAPTADDEIDTDGSIEGPFSYTADDVTLPCNNQGTTADLVYRWTASTNGCVYLTGHVAASGSGTHPFIGILDACSGEVLDCHQGNLPFEVEAGKTYLIATEAYSPGDQLGSIEIYSSCD